MKTKTMTKQKESAAMRGFQKLVYEERESRVASGLRHIKACVGLGFSSNNHECLRVQANSRAYIAIMWLDAAFVGPADYMGVASFWNHEYRHYMRDASNRQRQRAHAAMLKAGLPVSGVSDQHLEIIKKAIR